jgi:DNA invertase Pin-like site-specific DNA recombinase
VSRIGYARVGDVADQRSESDALRNEEITACLVDLGTASDGFSRQGLDDAIALCRPGDQLVVSRLSRLARTRDELVEILDDLASRGIDLRVSGQVYSLAKSDLRAAVGLMADFEGDVAVSRIEQERVDRRRRGGRISKLTAGQEVTVVRLYETGHSIQDLVEMSGVSRATVYRILERAGKKESGR